MKPSFSILLLVFSVSMPACQGNKQKFEPMADKIKATVLSEVKNIQRIDTVYLLIKVITPRDRRVIQAMEYTWASTEAKRAQNPDSAFYEWKANMMLSKTDRSDSTKFLYYIARANVIFTYQNLQKGILQKTIFFDKELNAIPKYAIFQKIAKTDNLKHDPQPYEPFSPGDYEYLDSIKVLKYY